MSDTQGGYTACVPCPYFHSEHHLEGNIWPGNTGGQCRRLWLHHNSQQVGTLRDYAFIHVDS